MEKGLPGPWSDACHIAHAPVIVAAITLARYPRVLLRLLTVHPRGITHRDVILGRSRPGPAAGHRSWLEP